MGRARHRWIGWALVLAAAGCDDLSSYATDEGEVYRGLVVGVEDPPVLRRGFEPETTLEMTFDPTRAFSLGEPPGVLTTSDGALDAVPLEPIVPLTHDVLSEYEIPSGGRVRNYIFVMHPREGPMAEREPMAFVSLMTDGTVEVRVIAGGGTADGDYFGIFRLEREDVE
ncbi:MAG TPA: hypothetical protein RMH99_18015 [Sandaracinaceae bacterium LLY-WYZ-13_1]|nr:hypothetical protein [Sandaracinaceae bacterium LLY-WYZ-13_1]